jgi:protein-S-isoprenylcysteine O-methyltransferase Ste14
MDSVIAILARRRVAIGAAVVLIALVVSQPTWLSWAIGLVVACVGEGLRVWAAGHLEKSREVTTSGPYRWMRHPLYVGSGVLAAGIVVAARSYVLAILAVVYMSTTVLAAIRIEEAFLRTAFGDSYDRYARAEGSAAPRRFSLELAMRNKEYLAVSGVAVGFGILALRLLLHV